MKEFKKNKIDIYSYLSCCLVIGIGLSNFFIRNSKIPKFFTYFFYYNNNIGFFLFLAFSVGFFLYEVIKKHNFKRYVPVLIGYLVFIILELIIYIHGVCIYEYWDNVSFEGSGNIIAKLVNVGVSKFNLSQKDSWCIAAGIRYTVNKTSYFIQFYFMIYSVALFFHESKRDILKTLMNGIELQLVFMIPFGIIEFFYLCGFGWANSLIELLFKQLYDIGYGNGWWPPLHWTGMRNIFGESSYFAIYTSIVVAFLIYSFFCYKVKRYFLEALILLFFVFCSNGRTCLVIFGQLVALTIAVLIINPKKYYKYVIMTVLSVLLCFYLAVLFSQSLEGEESPIPEGTTYFEYNVSTVVSEDARSNTARFSNLKACINVWEKHKLFGVSYPLTSQYMLEEMKAFDFDNEVFSWIVNQQKKGDLEPWGSYVGGYCKSLSEGGIVGLICDYILLFVNIIYWGLKLLKRKDGKSSETILCLVVLSSLFVCEINCVIYIAVPFTVVTLAFITSLLFRDLRNKQVG